MSHHDVAAPENKHEGEQTAKKSKNRTFLGIVLALIFLIVIRNILSGPSYDRERGTDQKDKTPTHSGYSYKKEVHFEANYKDTTFIPAGFMVSVVQASGPYCISNGDGSEEDCSESTEDISSSDKFTSENPQNKYLRFKSSNNQEGSCVLLLRSKF